MDTIISKVAAFGMPELVLVIAMASTGLIGAAAITAGLAALGPFGIIRRYCNFRRNWSSLTRIIGLRF